MIQRVEAGRELAAGALAQLGKTLPELIAQGVTSIRVDTSKVVEFDSQTLQAILEFDALARSRGLEVLLDRPSTLLEQALLITGLAERLDVRNAADARVGARPAPAGRVG